jgi:hypothetical protein
MKQADLQAPTETGRWLRERLLPTMSYDSILDSGSIQRFTGIKISISATLEEGSEYRDQDSTFKCDGSV